MYPRPYPRSACDTHQISLSAMNAFLNQIDPALARYAAYALLGVVVLALLRRLKHPRWKVVKSRSYSRRCLTITFPFGCDGPDHTTSWCGLIRQVSRARYPGAMSS